MATTTRPDPASKGPPAPSARRPAPWPVAFYRSAVGKKYVMAATGIVLLGYVLVHMLGNLKMYFGAADFNHYAEWLRELLVPFAPRTFILWMLRVALIGAFAFHIHAAYSLTRMNHAARAEKYRSKRDYVAADFASRTMRWTGVIVGLFVLFHLADLTWGFANPDFVRGDVYDNVVASFERVPVATIYIVANLALALHIYHGAWSMFQSLGLNSPRYNDARRWFAGSFAAVIAVGNISFPVMVLAGVVGG